jgi:hypothetical protein
MKEEALMRVLHRNRGDVPEARDREPGEATGQPDDTQPAAPEPVETERVETERVERVDVVDRRWSPGTALVALAGAALAVVGIVALTRTGINQSWYTPVEQVGGIDHTALLAAIEVGVGALLVFLGLAGARYLCALVCLAGAVAAAVAAVEPDRFQRELAIERWWAITLTVAGALLAIAAMWPTHTTVETHEHPARTTTRRVGGSSPQH